MKLNQIFKQQEINSLCDSSMRPILILIFLTVINIAKGQSPVTIEEKPLVLPTYQVAPPDKNPFFYSGRNYQGAQGHVYPYPMCDVLTDNRADKTYNSVNLNNEYLELNILPELGGRIFSALDKTNQFDFFYRQHVIKPSLIGMIGAWISGGVEWNIPDHHRASSNLPVDYTMVENPDGSKTVWVGETELSRGLKWIVGLTLYPGKSYVEATIKVINPTPFIHSFLYWANVSVHCDENYQVIFPPRTQYGVQHAKGEFTPWPKGDGMYGGEDRTSVDLSWWKNHQNPASIFAWNFTDDFLAGYDFAKDAGTVHVANHNVVTGKKFFLWGNNEEAKMWEKMLTEKDGQYIELMAGAYSDNQPDYSWIAPGETRVFKQYWYPIKKIGGVKNANKEAAVNLERKTPESIHVGFTTTSAYKNAKVVINGGKTILSEVKTDIDPANPFVRDISVDSKLEDTDIKVSLYDNDGYELISYAPQKLVKEEKPDPIETPKDPKEYKSVEELYLTGLRIEQFKNAIIDPQLYYREALSRDSLDYRVNTVMGIRCCKEGKYAEAEKYLRNAIARSTKDYTRPKDGEAFYYLGVVLNFQNRIQEATAQLWKATWYAGFQSPAYFRLAQMACKGNNFNEALSLIDQSVSVNTLNPSALALKAYVLRKTGDLKKAREIISNAETIDKLDNWVLSEKYFLEAVGKGSSGWNEISAAQFGQHVGGNVQYALELAKNYGSIGAYDEAVFILNQFRKTSTEQSGFPLLSYYSGFYSSAKGDLTAAKKFFLEASKASADYCFPWRLEEIEILKTAILQLPSDAMAWYYLGNLHYYLNQKEEAISDWEQSTKLDGQFCYAWRNLGFAYDKIRNDMTKSIDAYRHAIALNSQDPRFFAEHDEIMEKAGISPLERISVLKKHLAVIKKRDDATIRLINLYNLTGEYGNALDILNTRHFHVWEGNGSIHDNFEEANLLQGISFLDKKQYSKALASLKQATTYPENLEVGNSGNQVRNMRIKYYMALAYSGLKQNDMASEYLNWVAQFETSEVESEFKFYKAMALKKLNKTEEANAIFIQIRNDANEQHNSAGETDFFAKFGDQVGKESRSASNYYLIGLSYLGEGNQKAANENFQKSVDLDQNQLWAGFMLKMKNSKVFNGN